MWATALSPMTDTFPSWSGQPWRRPVIEELPRPPHLVEAPERAEVILFWMCVLHHGLRPSFEDRDPTITHLRYWTLAKALAKPSFILIEAGEKGTARLVSF